MNKSNELLKETLRKISSLAKIKEEQALIHSRFLWENAVSSDNPSAIELSGRINELKKVSTELREILALIEDEVYSKIDS